MTRTIEELIYDFANRQFQKAPINTARDLMCVCSDFANEFLAQPLSSRLTDEEKERVRKEYDWYKTNLSQLNEGGFDNSDPDVVLCSGVVRSLESIFGSELFKEK